MSAELHDDRRNLPAVDAGLAEAAARWVARRDAGLRPEEQEELRAWLRADSRHSQAFAAAEPDSCALNWPLHVGATDRILAGLEQRARRRRTRRRIASVACAAVLVLAVGLVALQRHDARSPGTIVVHAPRQQVLPDGSRVELAAGAELAVAYSATERRVDLLRGTAHFEVRKDPTLPFLVRTGDLTTRAVGTAFALSLEAQQVTLLVTEGRVAVDHGPRDLTTPPPGAPAASAAPRTSEPLAFVEAGEALAVDRHAAPTTPLVATALPSAEWQQRLAWRIPRLEFSNTALREAVATMNRYNREQLLIADPSLGDLRISGALRADRIAGLLEILDAEFRIVATREEGRIVLQRVP